jgi:folylpolyglutamate synthase/dihydropteroate synthase
MRYRAFNPVFISILLSCLIVVQLQVSMSSYQTTLRQLYKVNTFHPVKLGLENMHEINRMLGYPLKGKRIIHIAGTNGKGSVSLKLARSFEAVGLRTGLFTSPHISSFRERIQVNKEALNEEDVTVRSLSLTLGKVSVTLLLAFHREYYRVL